MYLCFQSPAVMSGASSLRQAPDMTPGAGVSSGGGHVYAPCPVSPAPPSPAPPSAMSGAPTSLLSAAGGATGHSMETAIVPQLQNIVSTVSLCCPLDLKKIALQVSTVRSTAGGYTSSETAAWPACQVRHWPIWPFQFWQKLATKRPIFLPIFCPNKDGSRKVSHLKLANIISGQAVQAFVDVTTCVVKTTPIYF